jgi:hypothetical protein
VNFKNKEEAITLLKEHNINVSNDLYVLYPKIGFFPTDAYKAINYLVDDCKFGLKYVDVTSINNSYDSSKK